MERKSEGKKKFEVYKLFLYVFLNLFYLFELFYCFLCRRFVFIYWVLGLGNTIYSWFVL